jgi:hypothetical protein
MAKTRRWKSPTGRRPQYKRFLVVVEGDVTERQYIEAAKRTRRIRSENVRIEHKYTDPLGIVREAKRLRNGAAKIDPYDEVWCVFDVEAKLNQKVRPGFANGLVMAAGTKISCGVSNPCFEVWLLLHAIDWTAWIDSNSAQRKCVELGITQTLNAKHIIDPETLVSGSFAAARGRAIDLDKMHETNGTTKVEDQNPSSGFYNLIDAILEAFPMPK